MTDADPGLEHGPDEFTAAQRASLDARRADQDRTLDTVHRLEATLAGAATGREPSWRTDVVGALADLDTATRDEQHNAAQPESLLSDITRTQPRLRNRVRGLRASYQQLRDTIEGLSAELVDTSDDINVDDVRRRLAWLLTAVRHQRARESDLIHEAYYEAFHRDLAADARGLP